jgi:hypothetical protein
MTFEHRMLVGFDEIKAIVFECNVCKTRVSIPMGQFDRAPVVCPKQHVWNINGPRLETSPVFSALSLLLTRLGSEDFQGQVGFKVFLEFAAKLDAI